MKLFKVKKGTKVSFWGKRSQQREDPKFNSALDILPDKTVWLKEDRIFKREQIHDHADMQNRKHYNMPPMFPEDDFRTKLVERGFTVIDPNCFVGEDKGFIAVPNGQVEVLG